MASQSLELPLSFTGEVRLFPLPDLVLFPGNALPLHIFESRYREMLEDALQDDQLIAIATLMPGFDNEYYSRPPISPAICVGRVTDHEKTAQGTYNLVLVGLQRAEVEHEIEPVKSFRRAKVKLIGERAAWEVAKTVKLEAQLADRVLQALPSAQKLIAEFLARRISFATLIDVLAFHLPLEVEFKLQLLAEADILVRAESLLANLPLADSEPDRTSRYPTDFSDN